MAGSSPAETFFFRVSLVSLADLSLIDKESDDVLERIMDEKTASESKILHGHSGPVYGISFSPDRWAAAQGTASYIQKSPFHTEEPLTYESLLHTEESLTYRRASYIQKSLLHSEQPIT